MEDLTRFEEIGTFLLEQPREFAELLANAEIEKVAVLELEDRVELSIPEIVAESGAAVVLVYADPDADGDWVQFGSGTIISRDGVVVTNYHVIEAGYREPVERVAVGLVDGRLFPVMGVLGFSRTEDIAVLKIPAADLPVAPVPPLEDEVAVGERVVVVGNSEGLSNTVSEGIVSGIRTYDADFISGKPIQMTAPIFQGNSGGAVFNRFGELVGVPTWSLYGIGSLEDQNLNFAVPINAVWLLLGADWEAH